MSEVNDIWPETQWSLIGMTRDEGEPERRGHAWRELVDKYHVAIEKVLRRYLAGCRDADDAVAGFFGYLYAGQLLDRPSSGQGRFRAFIQGVARVYAVKWQSEQAELSAVSLEGDSIEQAEPDSSAWLPTLLDMGLSSMRPKDAHVLRSYYGIGGEGKLTGEELASHLNIARSAAYKRVHGARLRLREELQKNLRQLTADDQAEAREIAWLDAFLDEDFELPPLA